MGYRHTQRAFEHTWIVPVALAATGVLLLLLGSNGPMYALAALTLVLAVLAATFSQLTVEIDDASIVTRFGWGWPRRRIPLARVAGSRPVRNRWYQGWGIRKVAGGWMYNVAGRDAVELDLGDGAVFRIGTDEPDALTAAIEHALVGAP